MHWYSKFSAGSTIVASMSCKRRSSQRASSMPMARSFRASAKRARSRVVSLVTRGTAARPTLTPPSAAAAAAVEVNKLLAAAIVGCTRVLASSVSDSESSLSASSGRPARSKGGRSGATQGFAVSAGRVLTSNAQHRQKHTSLAQQRAQVRTESLHQ
jgi:hypothetical protein